MKSKVYLIFTICVLIIWTLFVENKLSLYHDTNNLILSIGMIFGSFIAGISSEGGGAIAFPILTLLLDASPAIAKNFSFAIQSIGMTAASLYLIEKRTPYEKSTILPISIGGIIGLTLSTIYFPHILPSTLKVIFVSIWLSFAFVLFRHYKQQNDTSSEKKEFKTLPLFIIGILGGIISSFFGNGIDILSFSFLSLYYRVNLKTATTTSIYLMTILTLFGFGLQYFKGDIPLESWEYWKACIPVVIFGAPLGSLVLRFIKEKIIFILLISIIIIQYIGALLILGITQKTLFISSLSFTIGFIIFYCFYKLSTHTIKRG